MNDFTVVKSVPIPSVTFTKPDEKRECLGRFPIVSGDYVFGGAFLYKDQIRIGGEKVDPQRLTVSCGKLTLDGKEVDSYDVHNDDGTIDKKDCQRRKRRSEVESLKDCWSEKN